MGSFVGLRIASLDLDAAFASLYVFSSRRRHTRWPRDWSSDVCSSDLVKGIGDTIKDFSETLDDISKKIAQSAAKDQDKASQAVKWGTAVMQMWKNKKK